MAILQMKRISIYALRKDRKAVLELLQKRGVVEVDTAVKADSVFSRSDTSQSRSTFQKNIAQAASALEILSQYAPEKKSLFASLEGRAVRSDKDYDAFAARHSEVMEKAYRITSLSREIAENKAEIIKLEGQLQALQPWLGLEMSMRFKGTGRTRAFIGTLPGGMDLAMILAELARFDEKLPPVHVEVVSQSQNQTCIVAFAHKNDAPRVEEALRSCGFALAANPTKETPAEKKAALLEQIDSAKKAVVDAEKEIVSYENDRGDLQFAVDYYTMRSEKYEVLDTLAQSKHTFVLTGYILAKKADELKKDLESRFDLVAEISECDPKMHPPIMLENNALARPVEGVLESFGLPGRGEVDPCSVMSIFYYVLFGLMLSDAAYGLLIVLGCGFALLKFKNMESGLRKSLQMFFFSGLSTAFWGVMFGSFFGDLVNVVATTFFGRPDIAFRPLWFEPVKEPMRMLVFSMLMGIIHLFAGLAMNAWQCLKKKDYMAIVYDVVSWYLLLVGVILIGLSNEMFVGILQLDFILSSVWMTVGCVMALIGAVIILLFAGRTSKSPFKRILKGAYGLYGITGYLSDVLSYSRLLALGLATGVIATVINSMGSMLGGGFVGAIGFTLVFLVGHTLNLAINLLGSYVHTNRLQFVEFFGKFYEGGGRAFAPFAAHTKYYNIKEEIYHD
ncbi:MAG: V-type ATP synthase subunit I [Oscillospiraceae bacterium]|nr:V-type ATP synthase subunit I [Oscillospiraceae bacterium]